MTDEQQHWVSLAEFGNLAGISPGTGTYLKQNRLAICSSSKHININHAEAQKYLADRQKKITRSQERFRQQNLADATASDHKVKREQKEAEKEPQKAITRQKEVQVELFSQQYSSAEISSMTLKDLLKKFGSDKGLKEWLGAANKMVIFEQNELKLKRQQGKVVERENLGRIVFNYLYFLNKALLTDSVDTFSQRVVTLAKTKKSPVQAVKDEYITHLTRYLDETKQRILSYLKTDER